MKKYLLIPALLVAAAGSWAFYPNDSQPGTTQLAAYSEDGRGSIVITTPEGKVSVTQVKSSTRHLPGLNGGQAKRAAP